MKKASDTPKEPHRAFSVRIPMTMYEKIAEMAKADGVDLNPKVNQLLRLGLGEHVKLDDALRRIIRKEVLNG